MSVTILPSIQREMVRYGVTSYLISGLPGNIFCCMMFTQRSYRRTPSSVYLLSLSIFSIVFLIWTITPVLYTLNYQDPQTTSVLYCKVRQYGSHALSLQMRYVVVFATIDRFLVTRANVRIRSFSSMKTARILVCITPILCFAVASHMPVLTQIRNGVCGMTGPYRLVYAIYQNIVLSLTPPILMIVFSLLTMRSLHQRHDATQVRSRRRDRHLGRMVVAEVIINLLTSIPFAANLLYGAATYYVTNKSAERVEIEAFCNFIAQFCIYFLGVAPFYLFVLVSKPFRREFIHLIENGWNKCFKTQARIVPWNSSNIITTNNGRTTVNK